MSGPERPEPSEHHPYYGLYIEQVPPGPVLERLESELATTLDLLRGVPPELEEHRYAPGKWSVREVVGHLIDVERTFGYRALFMARSDPSTLPDFDQELWTRGSGHGERPLAALAEELELVRRSQLAMFRGLPDEAWLRRGVASGREFTVRCFPWIIAGHEIHHRKILRNRYLSEPEATA